MTLSSWALSNRHTVWAAVIGAIAFGALAYRNLPIQLFPDTAPPLVTILSRYPGAAAEDVADLVSDPIERESAGLSGVVRVTSSSQEGLSLVSVEFAYGTPVDIAAVDVQNAVSRIRATLPRELMDPQVMKFSTSNRPVLTMGVYAEDLVVVRRLAEEVWAPELQRLAGVALVDVFGGYVPEILVEVDRDRLEAHRLSMNAVIEAIRAYNVRAPAGQIAGQQRQYSFRIAGAVDSFAQLAAIPLAGSGGRVTIGQLARVSSGSGDHLSRFQVNGRPAIAMQVFKQDEANDVEVVKRVLGAFEDLQERYPQIGMMVADETASFTEQVVRNMLGSVWQALLLASVVILLFLGSLRRGLVVAFSMPLSFALTFAVMYLLGIELNMVTLTAVILAVGMVVDAAVVVLENITRLAQEEGLGPEEAALKGSTEIQFSVIAGAATTLVVLVPLLFLYGYTGRMFQPLAMTLIIAFSASVLVALAVAPLLTVLVSGKSGRAERLAWKVSRPWNWSMARLQKAYVTALTAALGVRWAVLVGAVVLFAAGLFLLLGQGMELLPQMDSGSSAITIETPSGSSLEATTQAVRQVEALLLAEPEVVRLATQIGFEPGMHSFGGGVQGPTQGFIAVTYTPRTARRETIWEIQTRLRSRIERLAGLQNFVIRETGSTARATTLSSIAVGLRGDDPLVLDRLGELALNAVRAVSGVANPYRTWRLDQRLVLLLLNAERAHELGISPLLAARELATSLDGVNVGMLKDRLGADTPIRVRYAPVFRRRAADALDARVRAPADGSSIPLRTIAASRSAIVQGLVTREQLQPTLQVLALHQGRPLSFVSRDVEAALAGIDVPQGYTVTLEGENRDMAESRDALLGALGMAVVGIYLLLVAQFRSFVQPLTVMMAIPLSLIGVALALWIAGKPVSMPVMIGLILLVGIVVNNSIVLLDFIRQRREGGMARREAIVDSVATRFRPIMMTSFSTVFGMLPLAFEWALGAERFSPLAIAVIGGMTASTFLTLIVIPVLYEALEDVHSLSSRCGSE